MPGTEYKCTHEESIRVTILTIRMALFSKSAEAAKGFAGEHQRKEDTPTPRNIGRKKRPLI